MGVGADGGEVVGHLQGGDPVGAQLGGGQGDGVDVPAAQLRGGHDLFGGQAVGGGDAEAVPGVGAGGGEGRGAVVEGLDLVGHGRDSSQKVNCCGSVLVEPVLIEPVLVVQLLWVGSGRTGVAGS